MIIKHRKIHSIFCGPNVKPIMPAGQLINTLGKYLYKNIDTSYNFRKSPNTFEVYFYFYTKTDKDVKPQRREITINLTTYQNKVRVNTIVFDPSERTLGCDVFKPEDLQNLEASKEKILKKVLMRLKRGFPDSKISF